MSNRCILTIKRSARYLETPGSRPLFEKPNLLLDRTFSFKGHASVTDFLSEFLYCTFLTFTHFLIFYCMYRYIYLSEC